MGGGSFFVGNVGVKVYLCACRGGYQPPANVAIGTMLPGGKHSLPLVGEGAPKGRMRWRLPLAQCRTTAHWQAPPHQSRLRRSSFPCERKPLGVYHVLTQFVNRVPSQDFGGSKPPPYGTRFNCLPVGTPLPGRPEKVAFGMVLPGGKRDDTAKQANAVRPYSAGIVFAPVGEAISLPQTLPSARCCRER